MNQIAFFEIQAQNPKKVVDFYNNVFGWKFTRDEQIPIEYYRIEGGGIMGGLLQRRCKTPPNEFGTNAFTCSIEVQNFDATAKLIMENGGKVAMEKFAVPDKCWQGYFIDADNNTFGIFEVDANAK